MPGNIYVYLLVALIKMLMPFLLGVEIICISYLLPNQTNVFSGHFEVLKLHTKILFSQLLKVHKDEEFVDTNMNPKHDWDPC